MNQYEQWLADAVADGWTSRPLYEHEAEVRMARLTKDGWVVYINNRPIHPNGYDERGVIIWGPDGLRVATPYPYNQNDLTAGLRTCLDCGAQDTPTRRVGFAGRVCYACLPLARKRLEYPGWTN